MVEEISLKVAEANQDDINKGVVRIDSSQMREIGIRPGNVVEIKGEGTTVAIADRALPGDIGMPIIRMDGLIRRNAKTTLGENVKITKADVVEAKKITIAPARKGIMVRANPQIFKRGLFGRAAIKGDIISLGGSRRRRTAFEDNPFFDEMNIFSMLDENMFNFGLGDLKFVVVETQPVKKAVLITDNTQIIFNPEAVDLKEEEKGLDVSYEDIGGLKEELHKVREMVELPLKHPEIFERLGIEPPKGVLLHGPPGTGKTLLAKAVANETNSSFYLINGPEIMSKYYGQSEENLRKKFEEAEKNAPSIIFIDEIDAIASKREESKGEVERRVVAQLLAIMDGLKSRGKVVVIAATNIPNSLDPALRRPGRFDREIEIGVPQAEGRHKILQIHTRNMPLYDVDRALLERSEESREKLSRITELPTVKKIIDEKRGREELIKTLQEILKIREDAHIKEVLSDEKLLETLCNAIQDKHIVSINKLAEITHGFVGADLSSLSKEAAMIVLRRAIPDLNVHDDEIPKEILEKLFITQEDFLEALKTVRPSAMREVLIEIPNVRWTDVGGLESVQEELREAVEWPLKHKDAFLRLGVKPPKGVLMYGPPGTGKTLLAKAVANEAESNFILVKGPELLSKWVGESEKAVRKIFEKARQTSPTIIFFDEIDSIAQARGMGDGDNRATEKVVNQLLTEIDGVQELSDIVVIAATNRPDILDPAILRPGRFDRIIMVGAPSVEARKKIFEVHMKNMEVDYESYEDIHEEDAKNDTSKINNGVSEDNLEEKPSIKPENIAKEQFIAKLADKTEGYAGADIESVCREAAILALREDMNVQKIGLKSFEKALDKVRPSITKEIEKAYTDLKDKFKKAQGNSIRDDKPSYYG